jgi:hypothetical protein
VRARAQEVETTGVGLLLHLGQRGAQVGLCLGRGLADAGDDLDRALEQLVLGLGVLAAGVVRADDAQDRRGGAGQFTGVAVDELEFDLDSQAGAL